MTYSQKFSSVIVEDNRGRADKSANNFRIILTDNGFRVTNNGNEYINAENLREDGTFTINHHRIKEGHRGPTDTTYECFLW